MPAQQRPSSYFSILSSSACTSSVTRSRASWARHLPIEDRTLRLGQARVQQVVDRHLVGAKGIRPIEQVDGHLEARVAHEAFLAGGLQLGRDVLDGVAEVTHVLIFAQPANEFPRRVGVLDAGGNGEDAAVEGSAVLAAAFGIRAPA